MVSDCDAIIDIYQGHHFAKSHAEAAAVAIKTGMDNECADFFTVARDSQDYQPFIDAVKQGLLSEADLDTSLRHCSRRACGWECSILRKKCRMRKFRTRRSIAQRIANSRSRSHASPWCC